MPKGANQKLKLIYLIKIMLEKTELRKDGKYYESSPWALSWYDENYYMIGYDSEEKKIKHYRVDKMLKSTCMEEIREGKELFDSFDIAAYTRKNFGMYGGEEQSVKIEFDNRLVGVVLDRFGKDIIIAPAENERFTIKVDVAVSDQFLGWVFALGDGAKILGPENVVERMKELARKALEKYR